MDSLMISRPILIWASVLAFGFPLLMLVVNEAVMRLRRRQEPIVSTLRIVRNWILPALAVLLLLTKVGGLPLDDVIVRIAQTVFWLTVIHGSLSLVNDVIFANAEEESWQANVPKLMIDVVRLILVLIGGAIVLGIVWKRDLTEWFTALGVGSVVIGLALQEPLGNVISGLMLMVERPIKVGDWVTADGVTGKVIEINWRSVHVETLTRELRIIPNSSLYKASFSNLSRPDTMRTEMIDLGFSYDDPPNKVKRVLMALMRSTPGILDDPPPLVWTVNYADFSITYRLVFTVAKPEGLAPARDDLMTRVWYAARRNGLNIPYPIQTEIALDPQTMGQNQPRPADVIASIPKFAVVDRGEAEEIGRGGTIRSFARGERIVEEGMPLEGLHLVLFGQVALGVNDRTGKVQEVARVGPGEFFGELSTTLGSRSSDVSITAVEDVDVLVLDSNAVQRWLDRSPRLVRELGLIMDVRRRAASAARKVSIPPR